MANLNQPTGLSPLRRLTGGGIQNTNLYWIPSTDSTYQYNIGDAVVAVSGGDANGIPQIGKGINAGAYTSTIRGVIVGFLLTPPANITLQGLVLDNTITYAPQTKSHDYYALVCDDQDMLYTIQGDGSAGTSAVAAACNKLAAITVANPTTPGMLSATVLTESTISASFSNTNLRMIGLYQAPNNAYGAYARWVVKINALDFANGGAGA